MGEWLERNRSNLAAILVVLVTVATVMLLQSPRRPALQVTGPSSSASPPAIKVHVVGAVRSPGVHQMEANARVEDALKAAGGPSESADVASLNLAMPLRDGQQLLVPEIGAQSQAAPVSLLPPSPIPSPRASPAQPPRASPTPRSGKLDLNGATRQELEALPGIGPVTAQKILDYRQKNGRIVAVEELKEAKLVNAPTYERIREMVEVR